MRRLLLLLLFSVFFLNACSADKPASNLHDNQQSKKMTDVSALAYVEAGEDYNLEAPIPAQCYTKTESKHNPCYVCHQSYSDKTRPNRMNDGFQQGSYAFSDVGASNSWKNLFKDRSDEIANVSDEEIVKYVAEDNYSPLIDWLKSDSWRGAIPEVKNLHLGAEAFDTFGLAKDGSRWVAYNYKPLPSTFWPTNGSTDDSFIKLPSHFSEHKGVFSREIYYANLALLEIAITDLTATTTIPFNEQAAGIDINLDGQLSLSETLIKRREHYIGDAQNEPLVHMLYPQGTAFLHTVRYLGFDDAGKIVPSKRMKEVRYMTKNNFMPKERVASRYYQEFKEKHFEKLPFSVDKADAGTSNGFGWMLVGFIEDQHGALRKQHPEEQGFCMGCHKTVGTSIDQTFSFPRKVAGRDGWGYIDLKKIRDVPNVGEQDGEYLTYLKRVGGGDEFRQNTEMLARWFNKDGSVKQDTVAGLKDIYSLIVPTKARALALNKVYQQVVKEQSYLYGRDVVLTPATNVFDAVDTDTSPLLPEFRYAWDIRLDWQHDQQSPKVAANKNLR